MSAQSNELLRAVELHDSELLSWRTAGTEVHLRLTAYVHEGARGGASGTGWQQEIELLIDGGVIGEIPRSAPFRILEGSLQIDGLPLEIIPLPFEAKGRVLIQLEGAEGEGRLMAIGDAVKVEPMGEARFIENVPFSPFPLLD